MARKWTRWKGSVCSISPNTKCATGGIATVPTIISAMASRLPTMVEGLELNEADDGLVVYEESRDRVHHLNATAALILELCDGTRDADAIADVLARGFELDERPLEETQTCLARLAEEGLIR